MSQHRSRTTTAFPSVPSADPTGSRSPINPLASSTGSCALATLVDQLRPSIAGIVGFSELLEFTDLDDEQAEFVAAISTASRQLDRLLSAIGALQDSSAACDDRSSGTQNHDDSVFTDTFDDDFVVPAVCTVGQLIDQAVSAVADHAAAREIEILADATGDDEQPILVDEGGLAVVLTNLVSNAVAYSNGRRVRVVAVRVRSDNEFNTYRFAVSDDGGSLDPSRAAQLFSNPSDALDRGVSASQTWGGLAANQEWVARHGGQIEVAVDPGTSTTFWFDIPVAVAYSETAA